VLKECEAMAAADMRNKWNAAENVMKKFPQSLVRFGVTDSGHPLLPAGI